MRTALILSLSILSACATPIRYSDTEDCALRGMKLTGVDITNSTASAYNFRTNAVTTAHGYHESARCEVPKDELEKSEIAKTQYSLGPKLKYNDGVGVMQFVNGVGYFAFVVPGVALAIAFENAKSKAIRESAALRTEANQPARIPTTAEK